MEIIRAGEIMAFHPEHQRLPYEEAYGFGGAFIIDRYCPLIEAAIPITDCGFMHADAVYDVVSVSRGAFFRLEQHQDRFARAREAIRVRSPYTRETKKPRFSTRSSPSPGCATPTCGGPSPAAPRRWGERRWSTRNASTAASTRSPCPFVFIADDEQRDPRPRPHRQPRPRPHLTPGRGPAGQEPALARYADGALRGR